MFPTLVTGNMEEYVTDAKIFKPARWLKEASNERLHPFASLPYGYGARMCLGRRFADLEMQVLLTKVRFTWFIKRRVSIRALHHILKTLKQNYNAGTTKSPRNVLGMSYKHS